MDNKRKYLLLTVISLVFLACNKGYYSIPKNEDYDIKIISRGVGTCADIILLNSNGEGKIIRGRALDFYTEEFKKFHYVEYISHFKIKNNEELGEINKIIKTIHSSEYFKGVQMSGGKHKEIFINNEKKMDIYGMRMNHLNKLLLKIMMFLPIDINDNCTSPTTPGDKVRG